MAEVLIIAEHDGSALNPATAKCVSCAAAIDGAEIDVLVLAATAGDIPAQAASLDGVSRVLTVERPENENALAAVQAPQILALADH
jgi:electron transfer flavoprotein alpha subunit